MTDPGRGGLRLPPGPIDAVCIDLDGTLLHTVPDLAAAANAMLLDIDHDVLPDSVIASYVGQGADVLIRKAIAGSRPRTVSVRTDGQALFEAARRHFHARYETLNGSQSSLFEGVVEGLASLREQGLKLACVTNKPTPFIAPLLERFGLAGYFDFAIGGDTMSRRKPDPDQLLEACRRWALAPARVVAVGDSVNDAQAGRAAGMHVYLVPYGYSGGEPVDRLESDGIVSSLLALARAIAHHHERLPQAR